MSTNFQVYVPNDVEVSAPAKLQRFAENRGVKVSKPSKIRAAWRFLNEAEFLTKKKVTRHEVVRFTRELATLLETGISIGQALRLLRNQRIGQPIEPVISQIGEDLAGGVSLAQAMASHSDVFDAGYIRTISSADAGAALGTTLKRAASFIDDRSSVIAEAKRQLVYPALILLIGLGVVIMLLTVSLPQMMGLFDSLDTELPVPTKILIGASEFLRGYPHYIFLALIVGFGVAYKSLKTKRGRRFMHVAALRTPILRKVVLYNDISRSSGALSSLMESGLAISDAMDVSSDAVGNDLVREAMGEVKLGLMAGEGMAVPMRKTGLFPESYIQSIDVGEQTGNLQETMAKMSEYYREEAQHSMKGLVGLIQPLSTVAVSLGVGFIALSVIMPMYSALGAIHE